MHAKQGIPSLPVCHLVTHKNEFYFVLPHWLKMCPKFRPCFYFFSSHFFYICGFETSLWVYSSLWWTWDQSRPYCSWHFSPAVAELVFCCMALCGNFSPRALISSNGAHVLLTLQERDRARELFQKEWEKSFSGKSFQFPMTEKASLMLLFVHVQAKVP